MRLEIRRKHGTQEMQKLRTGVSRVGGILLQLLGTNGRLLAAGGILDPVRRSDRRLFRPYPGCCAELLEHFCPQEHDRLGAD
jgi:hypothetical protein